MERISPGAYIYNVYYTLSGALTLIYMGAQGAPMIRLYNNHIRISSNVHNSICTLYVIYFYMYAYNYILILYSAYIYIYIDFKEYTE